MTHKAKNFVYEGAEDSHILIDGLYIFDGDDHAESRGGTMIRRASRKMRLHIPPRNCYSFSSYALTAIFSFKKYPVSCSSLEEVMRVARDRL